MKRSLYSFWIAGLFAALAPAAGAAGSAAPPPLSADRSRPAIDSTYGSGNFGSWRVDAFGLPAYRYEIDEATDPRAVQPTLANTTSAQHQLGNDHIKDFAYNDGYSQFWSQDRLSQWANRYDAANQHYGGGFGWLKVGDQVASTLYLDRRPGAGFTRDFGIGYYRKATDAAGVNVTETTYTPFGNDPLALDDVTLTNTTDSPQAVSWFEYWDVNPYNQSLGEQGNIGLAAPTWDAANRTFSAAQVTPRDPTTPLSIFAAQLAGPDDGHESSLSGFFGSGTRALPAAVGADRLAGGTAAATVPGQPSTALYAFRSHLKLAPGQSVTLRYAYGMAHAAQIAALVAKYRAADEPLATSERAWADWLPKADFGAGNKWVARELQWDAYLLRSATVYEELCGSHTITQGGDYQYADGYNLGFRSWPHYMLPVTYTDPWLAREILRYSTALQPQAGNQFPYGTGPMCERRDIGTSNDLDLWLLLAASEYGLGTRDTSFFDEQLPFYDTKQNASIWEHIKLAFSHQESLLGPHGGYVNGGLGDWDDGATEFEQMTESTLVTAQLAYVYPRLAQLADLRGDTAFAAQLRAAGARNLATERNEWTGKGWYSRGYQAGAKQLGAGMIFGEPQPWAILAGAPSDAQAATLVRNIRRYLDGIGAPASLGGPERIGTATIPARDDPDMTEVSPWPVKGPTGPFPDGQDAFLASSTTSLQGAAAWPGGVWYDVNGWLTWAYGSLDGRLPGARNLAWDEYTRNTLATHATAYPDSWNGTINVDDVCNGFYSANPDYCGNAQSTAFGGGITEQPTWMVMDAVRLAGYTPVSDGYDIAPHLPMAQFSLRMPRIGIASEDGRLRGYVTTERSGPVRLHVTLPDGVDGSRAVAWADGEQVVADVRNGVMSFTLPTTAGRPADWAVTW